MKLAVLIDVVIFVFLVAFLITYSFRGNTPYPEFAIIAFSEPLYRFMFYMIVYFLSLHDVLLSTLLLLAGVLVNIDYNNYVGFTFDP